MLLPLPRAVPLATKKVQIDRVKMDHEHSFTWVLGQENNEALCRRGRVSHPRRASLATANEQCDGIRTPLTWVDKPEAGYFTMHTPEEQSTFRPFSHCQKEALGLLGDGGDS